MTTSSCTSGTSSSRRAHCNGQSSPACFVGHPFFYCRVSITVRCSITHAYRACSDVAFSWKQPSAISFSHYPAPTRTSAPTRTHTQPHAQQVTLLVTIGADPILADGDGKTPLHKAAECGHVEVAAVLNKGIKVVRTTLHPPSSSSSFFTNKKM